MTVALSAETQALVDLAHQMMSCAEWAAHQGWALRRTGSELIGGCPKCGGSDRFAINTAKDVWNCRGCGVGGDVIFLVQHVEGLTLRPACERITGRTGTVVPSEAEQERLRQQRAAEAAKQAQVAEQYRQRARADAWAIWQAAKGHATGMVADYLRLRGLEDGELLLREDLPGMPLRLQPNRTYFHNGNALCSGPAMLAAIQGPDGHFCGLHQTWLDLRAPKGKLALPEVDGKPLPAKKVLGIKKGGAIRLLTASNPRRLVMGEGIETTLTAAAFEITESTAYWAGVDLGNMSGKAARYRSGGIAHDQPDMADTDCFVAPEWCETLVYLCDGDEPEKHTVEKVTRGLRRQQRLRATARAERPELPALQIRMVRPGEAGTDLNSLAMMGDTVEVDDASADGLAPADERTEPREAD